MIREVRAHKLHIFYDETHLITLAELGEKGSKIMHQVNIFRTIFELFVFKSSVHLVFESGDIDFWSVQNF